jgi:hypothetical protein
MGKKEKGGSGTGRRSRPAACEFLNLHQAVSVLSPAAWFVGLLRFPCGLPSVSFPSGSAAPYCFI